MPPPVLFRVYRPVRENKSGRPPGKNPVAQKFHIKTRGPGLAHPRYYRPADPAPLREETDGPRCRDCSVRKESLALQRDRRRDLHRVSQRRKNSEFVF